MFCCVYIGKMDIFCQYCSDTARGDAMSGKMKNKYLICQVIIYNIYSVFGQIKSQINRHSPADLAQIVDGPPMLQCGYVLSICTYISAITTGNKKRQIQLCSDSVKPGSTAARNPALHGCTPLGSLGACYHPFLLLSNTCIHAHTLLNY